MTGVAVLGAYGAVGRAALDLLRAWDVGPLRAGGRRPAKLAGLGDVETMTVDALDPASLARFCAGARTVLNCAGPAIDLVDLVARAAFEAGADYVDAAGDDELHARVGAALTGRPTGAAVISAGMMPGLTGLLPRLLAGHLPGGDRLTGYVGGRDRFTLTAAIDYIGADGGFGEPMAAWHDAQVRRGTVGIDSDVLVPFFAEPVTVYPYLSTETVRAAVTTGLRHVDWYSVFAGERILAALRSPPGPGPDGQREAARRLCRAAELDLFGHRPYQHLVLTLSGDTGTRTAVVRATGASGLTGTIAAMAARAVHARTVPAGVHHAAEVLDPYAVFADLADAPAVTHASVVDGVSHAVDSYEEDVI